MQTPCWEGSYKSLALNFKPLLHPAQDMEIKLICSFKALDEAVWWPSVVAHGCDLSTWDTEVEIVSVMAVQAGEY